MDGRDFGVLVDHAGTEKRRDAGGVVREAYGERRATSSEAWRRSGIAAEKLESGSRIASRTIACTDSA